MRYFVFLLLFLFSKMASANWQKVNDADYIWGPFKIYNLALFTETGSYYQGIRPLMLTLKYVKPVDGRDFAISLARSWESLGITLPEQDVVVDRLKKTIPNIKPDDSLSYIALQDRGYFVLNDTIIPEEFNIDFNNAMLSVWLDPRVEIARLVLNLEKKSTLEQGGKSEEKPEEPPVEPEKKAQPQKEKEVEQQVIPANDPMPLPAQPIS